MGYPTLTPMMTRYSTLVTTMDSSEKCEWKMSLTFSFALSAVIKCLMNTNNLHLVGNVWSIWCLQSLSKTYLIIHICAKFSRILWKKIGLIDWWNPREWVGCRTAATFALKVGWSLVSQPIYFILTHIDA